MVIGPRPRYAEKRDSRLGARVARGGSNLYPEIGPGFRFSIHPHDETFVSNKRALFIIFLTVFIDLLGFGIVLPLLPRYGRVLGATPATLGLLMASFSAMQFLFAPVWGRISDRLGRRPVLILGLVGSVVFYLLFGIASSYASLTLMFVARIGAGIAGATVATAQAYIADSTTSEQRTSGMALIGAAFGIGFTLGPMLGALALTIQPTVENHLSPMPGYLSAGLSAVALLLAIFMLPESLQPGSRQLARHWLDLRGFATALAKPVVGSLILVYFVVIFAFAKFESTLALFSKQAFAMDDRANFYLFAFTGLVLTLAQGILVRRLNKRIADEMMERSGIVMMSLGMFGLIGAAFAGSLAFLLAVLVVLVAGSALLGTSTQSLISRHSSPQEQGCVLGLNQSGAALARIFGPFIGIALFGDGTSTVRMVSPYLLGGLLLIGSLALVVRLPAIEEELVE